MMPLQAIEPRRLYQQIADQICEAITSGEYALGSRLPSERELSSRLRVSRTSVREALIALEITGVVEVRTGSGIYVTAGRQPLAQAGIVDAGPGPFEILEARIIVEGEIAAVAALGIQSQGLARLRETVDALKTVSQDQNARYEIDKAFHLAIAEETSNSALVQTVRTYWDQQRGTMWVRIEDHFHTPELVSAVIADHASIVDALSLHDPLEARLAMQRHLRRVKQQFETGWRKANVPVSRRARADRK